MRESLFSVFGEVRSSAFGGFGVVTFLLGAAALVVTLIKKGFKGYGFGVAQSLEIDADGFSIVMLVPTNCLMSIRLPRISTSSTPKLLITGTT